MKIVYGLGCFLYTRPHWHDSNVMQSTTVEELECRHKRKKVNKKPQIYCILLYIHYMYNMTLIPYLQGCVSLWQSSLALLQWHITSLSRESSIHIYNVNGNNHSWNETFFVSEVHPTKTLIFCTLLSVFSSILAFFCSQIVSVYCYSDVFSSIWTP